MYFTGILLDVVQLASRHQNELVAPPAQASELAPSVRETWHESLGIGRELRSLLRVVDEHPQAFAVNARKRCERQQVDERRRYVDDAGEPGNTGASRRSRVANDPGHPQCGFVEEEPVSSLSVRAKSFTVIRHQGHDRRFVQLSTRKPRKKLAHEAVGVGDFAAVARGVTVLRRLERSGRIVRRVGIVEMKEREEGLRLRGWLGSFLHPLDRTFQNLFSSPLDDEPIRNGLGLRLEIVVVGIEAPGDAKSRVENEGAHEPTRPITRLVQMRREGRDRFREIEADVVVHVVPQRRLAREQRCVRGECRRRYRMNLFEQHTLLGQPVDMGRRHIAASVAGKMIGPKRIDADQNEVPGLIARIASAVEGVEAR